ncbi:hypothetical protein ACFLTP_03330 [Chloroflexota bacterium]
MKRTLFLLLVLTLLSGLVFLVSCTCSQEQIADLPYGVVMDWTVDDELKTYKNKNNVVDLDANGW